MNKKQKKVLIRICITILMLILIVSSMHFCGNLIEDRPLLKLAMYMIPYLTIGYDILRKAFRGIIKRQLFDESFLMAVATIGAIALGEYLEGVAVMLFYQIGELFQSYAIGKSRRNISELMDIRPDYANLVTGNSASRVDPDEVNIGDVIEVAPGEKIPIDGVVIFGKSSLNTSALTGESLPREVTEGSEVMSGCINMTSLIRIRTTKEFGESTASKILELVENASSRKSKSENFISKFARIYTPAVCIGALALAFLPPVIMMLMGKDTDIKTWVLRALTFLVISCPCALVISIPLSFFAGIGGAGRLGILIKGSNYMETLAKTDVVVFDKTGTMTKGVFEVTKVKSVGVSEEELLRLTSLAESYSTHPISRSIIAHYEDKYKTEVCKDKVLEVNEVGGKGVNAVIDGHQVSVGNAKLMHDEGINADGLSKVNGAGANGSASKDKEAFDTALSAEGSSAQTGTVVHVSIDGAYAGYILISDVIKETAVSAVERLRKAGVGKLVMLTGDSKAAANEIADTLKVDEVYSELLPEDKVSHVEELMTAKKSGRSLCFVGDGINDAPVLARADIGIAMGALGSDAAIEAADVVLMDDDPVKIALSIKIARKCIRIVYENIYFAIGIKVLCLILGALGIANMWWAIFADVGVMVLAVLNAIRALFNK